MIKSMYMEMQLPHTICIIYYKERFSDRKGCISIYNLRKDVRTIKKDKEKMLYGGLYYEQR